MSKLRSKLISRRDDTFFGWEVKPLIDQLLPNLRNNVKSNLKSLSGKSDKIFKKLEALHLIDVLLF
ncbi:hypothetical protein C0J52_02161 [Blattella germanica]|nr:hypothetical protein C0J52_02161 [Blattella germanica]